MRGYTAGTPSAYEPPDAYEVDDECTLGELLPERAPVVGCPLWRNRDEEEDQPAEDAWDRSARLAPRKEKGSSQTAITAGRRPGAKSRASKRTARLRSQ